MVAKGVSNLEGDGLTNLRMAVAPGRYRYYRNYLGYLQASDELAQELSVPTQNIEYVLWLAGKKNQ